MPVTKFLDTNILVYAYDLGTPSKQSIARQLVEEGWATRGATAISVQVLLELHANLRRRGASPEKTDQIIGDFCQWPVIENTLALFRLGLSLQARWQLSLWDAMIVAAAQTSGARELFTEDLNHGQDYGGVRVVNPFHLTR
jgi:predicted nucleic acid-binding protein